MNFEVKKSDDACLITQHGDFNIYSSPAFIAELKSALKSSNKIAVDLAGVNEIDTSGIQALIAVKKECAKTGKQFKIINHSHAIIRMLDLLGLVGFFGDKIKIIPEDRSRYSLKYGVKKQNVLV
jgi:anti-anti-sigma factor